MSLAQRQAVADPAAAFRRDGYVVVRGLFSPAAREAVLADIVTAFRTRAQALGLDLPAGTDQAAFTELACGLFRRDIPAYVAAAKLSQHTVGLHRMGVSPELMAAICGLGLAAPAISTRPVIHYMCERLKIPGGYQKSPAHQDWRSVQGSLDGVTVWSPLYDVGLGDHPLEIIPGSHRAGLLPSEPDLPNYRIPEPHYDEAAFEALPLRAGDAVLFSGFLVHRTGERGCDQVRVAASFRFNNLAEPSFVRRNYPNPYIYRADPEILTPDFPAPQDLAGVFESPEP
jgi:ectoine hydroxylase-related dioxygenase (phytanoyl-CoA dioxygenase family)